MSDPWTLPGHVAPRELPGKDGAAWLRTSIEGMASMAEAVAFVEAPARAVAARIPEGAGTVESIAERRCRVRLHADTIPWQAMRLLRLEADFVVESTPELVDYLRALGGRVTHAIGGAESAAATRALREEHE